MLLPDSKTSYVVKITMKLQLQEIWRKFVSGKTKKIVSVTISQKFLSKIYQHNSKILHTNRL